MNDLKIDIIGDIHGHFDTLIKLGTLLGYDVEDGWSHKDDERTLVFLGDLIDRGPGSLEVAESVMKLVQTGRAMCLMGNHEYNLVRWWQGGLEPKRSNRKTISDVRARSERWKPVIEFFRTLPIAVELPDLRIIHAVWHTECFAAVRSAIAPHVALTSPHPRTAALFERVVVPSPFVGSSIDPALPNACLLPGGDKPHEILIKGHEVRVEEEFTDSDGTKRSFIRSTWWKDQDDVVPRNKRTIFGHYWNLPPVPFVHPEGESRWTPPYASGHHDLRSWIKDKVKLAVLADSGRAEVSASVKAVCIDFNGVILDGGHSCVGAYRYPEAEVVWVSALRVSADVTTRRQKLRELSDLGEKLKAAGGPANDGAGFEAYLAAQEDALALFGLPATSTFLELLEGITKASVDGLIDRLSKIAKAHAETRSDRTELSVLRAGVRAEKTPFDVLPELGIETHVYTTWLYEQIDPDDDVSLQRILDELRRAEPVLNELGLLEAEGVETHPDFYANLKKRGLLCLDAFLGLEE